MNHFERTGKAPRTMNLDDLEDFLELQNPETRRQIRTSILEYRRGKAREASSSLRELRRRSLKSKK